MFIFVCEISEALIKQQNVMEWWRSSLGNQIISFMVTILYVRLMCWNVLEKRWEGLEMRNQASSAVTSPSFDLESVQVNLYWVSWHLVLYGQIIYVSSVYNWPKRALPRDRVRFPSSDSRISWEFIVFLPSPVLGFSSR